MAQIIFLNICYVEKTDEKDIYQNVNTDYFWRILIYSVLFIIFQILYDNFTLLL